jgi:hypothetical protein
MRYLHRVPGESMMGLMSDVLGTHGYVVAPELCRTVVLVPRSCGDDRAFLSRGWAWSHEARGDSGAFS